jgi:hypothetical protein
MRQKAAGSSKTVSDLKKSADPGEWIDAFCVFLLSLPSWPKLSLRRGAHARQLAESVFPRID